MAVNPNHVHDRGHDDGDEESEGLHNVNSVNDNNHIPREADHRYIASSSSSSSSGTITATTTVTSSSSSSAAAAAAPQCLPIGSSADPKICLLMRSPSATVPRVAMVDHHGMMMMRVSSSLFSSSSARCVRHFFWFFLFQNKFSWLLLSIPASFIAKATGWNSKVFLFITSLIGIVPLAERLGYVTEQLAFYTGSTVGGLLNATFGNATEIIICLCALHNGLMRVVQLSLLGSILSNVLLVQGCAFFLGGLFRLEQGQKFSKAVAGVNCGLLLMAVMGVLLPAVLHYTHTETKDGILSLSRFSSCVMLLAYTAFLYFQLKSHKHLYDIPNENELLEEEIGIEMSAWGAIFWLAAVTALISVLSNNLVDAIEDASVSLDIPLPFISVIILPIAGNAAEHAGAIIFAMKDKLDLSLAVAIGSSIQIAMFVIPLCVVIGWIMGKRMDLDFQIFETATLMVTVIVVAFLLQEGKSNYFKGLMLILCYLIVAASFFVHHDRSNSSDTGLL